jgi:transposase
MSTLQLTPGQRRRLRQRLRGSSDAGQCRRLLALLELDRGQTPQQVADLLGVTRQTVYNWADRFAARLDPDALIDRDRPGRPEVWTDALRSILRASLDRRPDQYGYPNVNWTVGLLREHLDRCGGQRLSDDTIRRELDRLGYVWKRCRYVLPPDPAREKKTRHPAAIAGLAGPSRDAGRGRNRPAALPTPGGRVGEARTGGSGADLR